MKKRPPLYSMNGLNVDTYDVQSRSYSAAGEVLALKGDVDFYKRYALESGGPILDLACGTGRVTWPLAEAGLDVVGIDISEAMLARARENASEYPEEVRRRAEFVHGDMRNFDAGRTFALVVIAYRSFLSLVTSRDERSCLECVYKHLNPGGRLVLNVFDPRLDYCLPDAPPPVVRNEGYTHPVTGNEVRVKVAERTTDPFRQVMEERWVFRELGGDGAVLREEEETLTLRWIYRQEMLHLFELTRFEVVEEYSDFQGGAPAYGKEQVWVVGRK